MAAKRSLPSWMCACDSGSSGQKGSEVNRKKGGGQKRPERAMLYWMNERELAETALSVLLTNTVKPTNVTCPGADVEASVIPETDTEEESDLDTQERISGSDYNVDVAEQQTVPYITFLEKERSSVRSDSAGDLHDIPSKVLGKDSEVDDDSQGSKTDPEALQLVREIFFS